MYDFIETFIKTVENLYSLKDALYKGTIFKDLYRPYKEDNSVNKCR